MQGQLKSHLQYKYLFTTVDLQRISSVSLYLKILKIGGKDEKGQIFGKGSNKYVISQKPPEISVRSSEV